MIHSFRHKGLELFYRTGVVKGIQANHAKRLRMPLLALDTASVLEDLDIPGYRLHKLKGSREGLLSITVSGNWRLTFEFSNGHVYSLNFEDYH